MRATSLITWPPAGMITRASPPKVSARMVSATAAAVPGPAARAMEACVMVSGDWPYRLDRVTRAPVPPTEVCTTLRTERPAMPVVPVPGSAAAGAVAQAPTQAPVEAGATSPCGRRPPVCSAWALVPSSADAPAYMAAEIATIRVTIAASRARCLVGGAPAPPSGPRVMLFCSPRARGAPRLRSDEPMMRHGRRKGRGSPGRSPSRDRRRELVFRSGSRSGRDNV